MFQRLMTIPQDEYMQLTAVQQARQPLTQQFYSLENQYRKQDRILDPYNRLLLQSETLEQMKGLKERMRENISITSPKPYKNRALALYQSIQPFIKFNEKGEIYDKNGQLISQSRLEDLIQHAVRDRRRSIQPQGWNDFMLLMRENNVPKTTLNRNTLEEIDSTSSLKIEPFPSRKRVSERPKAKAKRARLSPVKTEASPPTPKRTRKKKPTKETFELPQQYRHKPVKTESSTPIRKSMRARKSKREDVAFLQKYN